MRLAAVITALLFSACSTSAPKVTVVPAPPPEPVQQTALQEVWQKEVIEDVAILKAIRPNITGPAPALNLYDSATQGLASLSGEPTAKDVDAFKALVAKPDDKALAALRAEKVALDKKTDELEAKVEEERKARIKAEADKKAADEAALQAAIQSRKDKAVSKLTTVGAVAAGVGVLALLFGSWLNISKITAGLVIAAGIGISVIAPWVVDLAELKVVIIGLVAFLATDLFVFVGIKTYRYLRNEQTPPKP